MCRKCCTLIHCWRKMQFQLDFYVLKIVQLQQYYDWMKTTRTHEVLIHSPFISFELDNESNISNWKLHKQNMWWTENVQYQGKITNCFAEMASKHIYPSLKMEYSRVWFVYVAHSPPAHISFANRAQRYEGTKEQEIFWWFLVHLFCFSLESLCCCTYSKRNIRVPSNIIAFSFSLAPSHNLVLANVKTCNFPFFLCIASNT